MALFRKAEFAAECGVSKAHVSMAIKRSKVVPNDDGMIDTDLGVNAAYKLKCREDQEKRVQPLAKPEGKPERKERAKKEKPARAAQPKLDPEVRKNITRKQEVELQEKEAKIRKLEQEMRLSQMKEGKMAGKLIPTDLVASTIRQLMQSVTVSFSDGADALLNDVAKELKIDRQKMAGVRKKLKNVVNEAVSRAVSDAQKNVTNIIQEHSQGSKAA
jgi:hypothetical protein